MGFKPNPLPDLTPNCRVRITSHLNGVWDMYQPEVGEVYDAFYRKSQCRQAPFVLLEIMGKLIVVREDEFEFVEVPG